MKISTDVSAMIMEAIAYTLGVTVCRGEKFDTLSKAELAEYINNTARKIFVDFCNETGVEAEEEP